MFDLRPLHMFYQPAKWNGKEVQRFTRIADPAVIVQLQAIKARITFLLVVSFEEENQQRS